MKKRKYLLVSPNTLEAVTYFAEKFNITVQEATDSLLRKSLYQMTGIRLEQLKGAKAIRKAFKDIDSPKKRKDMRLRLQLPKDIEQALVVSPDLHLAITEYARIKAITIHEATFFLLRDQIGWQFGLYRDQPRDKEIVIKAFKYFNDVEL